MREIQIAHIRQVQTENKRWAHKVYYYSGPTGNFYSAYKLGYRDTKEEVLDYYVKYYNIDGIVEGDLTKDEILSFIKKRYNELYNANKIPVLNEEGFCTPKTKEEIENDLNPDPRVKCPYCNLTSIAIYY